MEIIIILIKIALILFVGYASFIIAYRIFYRVSLDDAEKAVNSLIKDNINAHIFNKKELIPEPVPDMVLLNKLLEILESVNMLESDSTAWQFEPNFHGFPVLVFDIVASVDTDFDLLHIQLKKTTQNYLLECGFDPLVYVYSGKHGDSEYYIFVCYAVYEYAKTALRKFIENRTIVERKNAIGKVAPVINASLEQELAEMKKGEENERL